MAALAVCAELKYRDGLREKISVNVENNLSSLVAGIKELNQNVSRLLSDLVEREKSQGGCEVDEDDSDEDEDEDNPIHSVLQPPAKRCKN